MSEDARWLIWSYEHAGWWRPGGWGYTRELAEAGRYSREEADRIVAQANIVTIHEIAVPLAEAASFPAAMTDEALIAAAAIEMQDHEAPIELVLRPTSAFQLAALLQLTLRHPQIHAHSDNSTRTALTFLEHVRAYFADAPAILEMLRRGDDPEHDR